MSRQKGFTLIEFLIVIAIIGIIAAVAIPSLFRARIGADTARFQKHFQVNLSPYAHSLYPEQWLDEDQKSILHPVVAERIRQLCGPDPFEPPAVLKSEPTIDPETAQNRLRMLAEERSGRKTPVQRSQECADARAIAGRLGLLPVEVPAP